MIFVNFKSDFSFDTLTVQQYLFTRYFYVYFEM